MYRARTMKSIRWLRRSASCSSSISLLFSLVIEKERNSTPNLAAAVSRSEWFATMTGTSTFHSPEWLRASTSLRHDGSLETKTAILRISSEEWSDHSVSDPSPMESAELLGYLPIRPREGRNVPLEARVVVPALRVHVLVVVEDDPSMGVDELGQAGAHAQTQRAVQQEDDRAGFFLFTLWNGHSPDRTAQSMRSGPPAQTKLAPTPASSDWIAASAIPRRGPAMVPCGPSMLR